MNCPCCKQTKTSDPCSECGFLVDPKGDGTARVFGTNQAQPGGGMSFLTGGIIQNWVKANPEAASGEVIDRGQSYIASNRVTIDRSAGAK